MKSTLMIAGMAALAGASPVAKRATTSTMSDATILNYALTLEHLEATFYNQGLKNFTAQQFANAGYNATFYNNLKNSAIDENTHVSFLTSALQAAGATPVAACTYNFGVTDVPSFIKTASILEGVGVSAYIGAAQNISSDAYLTAAASILAVEARHSSYFRAQLQELPYPKPFDTPLTLDEVYSLAAPFIVSCPKSNPPLPVKAFPHLTITGAVPILTGTSITISAPGKVNSPTGQVYAAFLSLQGPQFVKTTASSKTGTYTVTVPAGVNGQSYIVLTSCNTEVTDASTLAVGLVEVSNPTYVAA